MFLLVPFVFPKADLDETQEEKTQEQVELEQAEASIVRFAQNFGEIVSERGERNNPKIATEVYYLDGDIYVALVFRGYEGFYNNIRKAEGFVKDAIMTAQENDAKKWQVVKDKPIQLTFYFYQYERENGKRQANPVSVASLSAPLQKFANVEVDELEDGEVWEIGEFHRLDKVETVDNWGDLQNTNDNRPSHLPKYPLEEINEKATKKGPEIANENKELMTIGRVLRGISLLFVPAVGVIFDLVFLVDREENAKKRWGN